MSRAAGSPLLWPNALDAASVHATTTGQGRRFLFMIEMLNSLRCDDPIEPVQPVTRRAFRFRLAVVNPLNAIGTAGAPRSHGLPVAQVVAVLNVIDLTGQGREFNHKG